MKKQKQTTTNFTAKVIIVGDTAVGKTNILVRFCNNQYNPSLLSTVGIDFRNKSVQVDGNSLRLQLWDTAGQERFKNVNQTYFKGAYAVILVYSITDRHSFESVQSWVAQINQNSSKDIAKFLVGSKCDLEYQRKVSSGQGLQMAKRFEMEFIEVSSKSGKNIDELFKNLSSKVMNLLIKKQKKIAEEKDKDKKSKDYGKRISLDRREDVVKKQRCKC